MSLPDLAALLADPKGVAEINPEAIPPLLCQLAALQSALAARLVSGRGNGQLQAQPERDRLLTPEEAGQRLGVTAKWLYRHHKRLPFTRQLSRKVLRFSESGLRKWQAAKRA